MLNLSVIGTSGITEKFLSAARKTGRFKFHTVYSRTAEKGRAFAEKQGFEGFCTDINALAIDGATDAVYIWIRSALVRMWMRSSWLPPTICTRTPS